MDPRDLSGTTPDATLPDIPPVVLILPVVRERMLVFDGVRWCCRCEGTGWEGPERRWFEE